MTAEERSVLAGELALGVLDGPERADALRLLIGDRDFAREVERWRDWFAAWFAIFPDVEPDPALEDRIMAALPGAAANDDATGRSARLWRTVAGVASVAAACLLAALLLQPQRLAPPVPVPAPAPTVVERVPVPGPRVVERVPVPGPTVVERVPVPGPTVVERVPVPGPTVVERVPVPGPTVVVPVAPASLVAALNPTDDADDAVDAPFAAVFDRAAGTVTLAASLQVPAGRVAQLWWIGGDKTPRSLGLLPGGATPRLTIPPEARGQLVGGVTLAVSIEPAGGSRTGLPTGPIVATGPLSAV